MRGEIQPTAIVVWKRGSEELQGLWPKLAQACSEAELKTVADGLRAAATYHISSENIVEGLRRLERLGLRFTPIRECKPVSGFAHRFYEREPGKPYSVYGAVARDESVLREFVDASERGDHRALGELLGYPDCCVRFFCEVWPGVVDPVWEAARNAAGVAEPSLVVKDYYPEVLPILRYFGVRAVPHLPCSFLCEASKRFASLFLDYIPREVLDVLSLPMTWDCWKGVALVESPYFLGIANSNFSWERRIVTVQGKGRGPCTGRA